MRHITAKTQAATVPQRWRMQYERNRFGDEKAHITKALDELKRRTPEAINRIIGNDSWTTFLCRECDTSRTDGVEFGRDESTSIVCRDCIRAASALLED
jgi:hypothetical protein